MARSVSRRAMATVSDRASIDAPRRTPQAQPHVRSASSWTRVGVGSTASRDSRAAISTWFNARSDGGHVPALRGDAQPLQVQHRWSRAHEDQADAVTDPVHEPVQGGGDRVPGIDGELVQDDDRAVTSGRARPVALLRAVADHAQAAVAQRIGQLGGETLEHLDQVEAAPEIAPADSGAGTGLVRPGGDQRRLSGSGLGPDHHDALISGWPRRDVSPAGDAERSAGRSTGTSKAGRTHDPRFRPNLWHSSTPLTPRSLSDHSGAVGGELSSSRRRIHPGEIDAGDQGRRPPCRRRGGVTVWVRPALMARTSERECAPSLRYSDRVSVFTVLCDT